MNKSRRLDKNELLEYKVRIDALNKRMDEFVHGYKRRLIIKDGMITIQIKATDYRDWINAVSE